jgi:hypothetical protein
MKMQPSEFIRLSRLYARAAAGWGRIAALDIADSNRVEEAVKAARAAWRHALDAQAAKEGRLYE